MLIPRKPKRSRQSKREWFNKKKIKEPVKKELAEKTKKLIEKKSKSQVKQVIYSYMCPGCKSSFNAGNLQTRIIEAARRGDSYISCPKCGVHLVADRTTKISTKQNSKVNRNANLTITYPNQGINITPSYTPSSWIDRSILERIAHELGKYCQKFGFFNPQLKFQRGIRGKTSANTVENVRAAEFTVEAVDDYDLRFRVVAAAGITPAGKVVLPKFFMTLDGREIPFTKEAVAEFLSGKVFGSTDPKPVVPELHYKDRDPVRFREIVASRKKKAVTKTGGGDFGFIEPQNLPNGWTIWASGWWEKPGIIFYMIEMYRTDTEEEYEFLWGSKEVDEDNEGAVNAIETQTKEKFEQYKEEVSKRQPPEGFQYEMKVSKKAAGTPTPGQTVEYQGKNYTIDSITGDASILTDEAGVQTAPVPNADLNVQFEEGAMPAEISAPTLADRINKLVKRSLRDEKTLVPFTDPAPDYSVAKQTDVDADFSVPYKDSDQGILSEEERAVQKMFRGGSVIKPVKTAIKKTAAWVRSDIINEYFLVWNYTWGEWYKIPGEEDEAEVQTGILELMKVEGKEERSIWTKQLTLDEWDILWRDIEDPDEAADNLTKVLTALLETPSPENVRSLKIASIKKTALTTWVDCNVEEPKPGYTVKGEKGEGTVVGFWDKGVTVSFEGEEVELHAGDDFVFDRNPYKLYDAEGNYIPVKENYEKQQEEWSRESSRKKIAEPTGYHETDDTGKVIELSRLRTLVQDYARAGQLPLDFDLTKVMSEVSRMTRKDLLEILDKKQKDTHYPVVHAKKEGLEKKAGTWTLPFTVSKAQRLQRLVDEYAMKEEYDPEALESVLNVLIGDDELYDDLDKAKNSVEAVELIKARLGYFLSDYEEDPENFRDKLEAPAKEILVGIVTASNKKVLKISSKSTNAIVREIRKKALVGDLTEEDVKEDIKEEKEGEKHYNQMAKDVDSPKTEKVLKDMADEEAEHAEDLEEIVLPAVKNTQNYLEKYDSRKKKTAVMDIPVKTLYDVDGECYLGRMHIHDYHISAGTEGLLHSYSPNTSVVEIEAQAIFDANPDLKERILAAYEEDDLYSSVKNEEFAQGDYAWWENLATSGKSINITITTDALDLIKQASRKKKAQEEGEEEKPKTTLKELKTKPHGRPAPEEVAEAPAAAPELQTVFNEVKQHQQRLTEIKAIISAARQKTEEEIRKIQEEQGSVAEAAELQEGIEKLSSLIEQSESQIADLGEFFVWLDTESKTKKFKPTDKWRVEKLLEKFGKDAEEYLTKAEKGASSLNTEIEQRLLTVFPKLPKDKEGSIQKRADVLDSIAELGSGLWSYVKEISGIISEGEQLELALE